MGSFLRSLLRWADKGTDLADRAGSLDDQAEAELKFSPLARAAGLLVAAYGAVAAVVSGTVAYVSPWIAPYGPYGWLMATVAGTAALTALGWLLGAAGLSLRERWRVFRAAGAPASPAPPSGAAEAPPAPNRPADDGAAIAQLLRDLREKDAALRELAEKVEQLDRVLHPKGHGLATTDGVTELAGRLAAVADLGDRMERLRFWMAEASRVHMDAVRVTVARRLAAEAPRPPEGGEEAGAEAMERFARAVDGYAWSVGSVAGHWGLTEAAHFPATRAQAERAAEAELEGGDAERRLSGAEYGTLRRYRIAVRHGEAVAAYLARQAALAEGKQEDGLTNLMFYYEQERPRYETT